MVKLHDLLCYSSTMGQHLLDVREVLAVLRQEKLYVKASECEFGRGFLGHWVSAAGAAVDPHKVASVQQWQVRTSNVDLRRFIGLCNHYPRFVDAYADIASPLTRLCGPYAIQVWALGPTEQQDYDRLKACLMAAPVLRTFDPRRRSVFTTERYARTTRQ